MSSRINQLGLSPRLPDIAKTKNTIRRNSNGPIYTGISSFKRQNNSQKEKQLGSWRQRRNIVTKKAGTLKGINRQINGNNIHPTTSLNNGDRSDANTNDVENQENEEDKLLEFNQAFQDAILATMDREISTYEDQLMDKSVQIADITRSKEDLAIALLEEKKRAEMLNKALSTSKKTIKERENELALVNLENNGLKQSLENARNGEDESRLKCKSLKNELETH